ncbi:hypothetical protein J6TS2_31700 [Heyndrickxia sporothermodurans]|nr:hypothetical protein J6TS2_31700 [Heyndrickxia sporothermodurans]
MSQEEIAEKLHISRSNISKLENNKITLDVQTLVQWIEVTNAKEVMIAAFCGFRSSDNITNDSKYFYYVRYFIEI